MADKKGSRKGTVDLPEEFSLEVVKIRSAKRLSQAELAARSKVSPRIISQLETGTLTRLTPLKILRIVLGLEHNDVSKQVELLKKAGITLAMLNKLREQVSRKAGVEAGA